MNEAFWDSLTLSFFTLLFNDVVQLKQKLLLEKPDMVKRWDQLAIKGVREVLDMYFTNPELKRLMAHMHHCYGE